jgi:hypothetical protein
MEHLSTEVEHQQIAWRRAKVLELSSQGHSQREIADIIHVGIGTVNRDLAYLSQQAQDNLKIHIQEKLPEQYQKCMTGLNQVLRVVWDIVRSDSSSPANRLAALSLINDSYKYLMDLTTNGVVITDAIGFVQTNKEKRMSAKDEDKESKELYSNEGEGRPEGEQEEETEKPEEEPINQVF